MTGSSAEAVASARAFAIEAARLLHDRHCEDVLLLDVQGLSQVCNFVLIGSGTSDRQMKAVAHELHDLGDERGHPCFRSSADTDATWIVVDFVDIVMHMFEPGLRTYYDLEGLWSDARRVPWTRNGEGDGSDAAGYGSA